MSLHAGEQGHLESLPSSPIRGSPQRSLGRRAVPKSSSRRGSGRATQSPNASAGQRTSAGRIRGSERPGCPEQIRGRGCRSARTRGRGPEGPAEKPELPRRQQRVHGEAPASPTALPGSAARPASVRPARIRPSAALPDACPPHACSRPASTVPCCTQANPGPRGHAPARPPREASRWKGRSEPRPRPSHLSVLRRDAEKKLGAAANSPVKGGGGDPPPPPRRGSDPSVESPACRKGRVGPPTVI